MKYSENIEFRQYRPADLTELRELHEHALKSAGVFEIRYADDDLDNIQAEYYDKGGDFLVGTLNGRIVAMGAFRAYREPETVELKRMRVRPELQGEGIGSRLIQLLESNARDRGYTSAVLDTIQGTAGQRLYERHGYLVVRQDNSDGANRVFYRKVL